MAQQLTQTQFKGMKSDFGEKFTPQEYFYDVLNFNQDDIIGANKVLCPVLVNTYNFAKASSVDLVSDIDNIINFDQLLYPSTSILEYSAGNDIDGLFEYKYLNQNNVLVTEEIIISGGNIYKNLINPIQIYSGLGKGRCKFSVMNDQLYIANGKNYTIVYNGANGNIYQMGAPEAVSNAVYETINGTSIQTFNPTGNLTGTYYYAMTYVTSGGEECIGTVSNTVILNNNKVLLNLPIGYDGTESRKIYRTLANGTQLKLVATISDNTTLTYTDNNLDTTLGTNIINVNNECPKTYFIETTFNNRLAGCVCDKYPTQAFVTDVGLVVWDLASFVDVANRSQDNTPIVGMCQDYNLVVVGTSKQIYTLNVSGIYIDPTIGYALQTGASNTGSNVVYVDVSRANIGVLDGYSMVKTPAQGVFDGGVMFIATDYTIRQLSGNFAQPVSTSLDNIKTYNLAQDIRQSLIYDLQEGRKIYAEFYMFKYHFFVGSKMYTFDIRTQGWMKCQFKTTSFESTPNVMSVIGNELYNGQIGVSNVEKMYQTVQYRGENCSGYLEFPRWVVSDQFKLIKGIEVWFKNSSDLNIILTIILDENVDNPLVVTINNSDNTSFDAQYFNPTFFDSGYVYEDYRYVYVNFRARSVKMRIDTPTGVFSCFDSDYFDPDYFAAGETDLGYQDMIYFRGLKLNYDDLSNKEIAA